MTGIALTVRNLVRLSCAISVAVCSTESVQRLTIFLKMTIGNVLRARFED